jgi:hypothetical protein
VEVLPPPTLSETRTANEAVDAAVGVPDIWPTAASDKPAGSAPELSAQVYDPVPPLAWSVCK